GRPTAVARTRGGARGRHRVDRRRPRRPAASGWGAGRVTSTLLLAHGDDSLGLDSAVSEFAAEIGADEQVEINAATTSDDAIARAALEAGTMSLFGTHLTVLRQPLRAAVRSAASADRLM